MTVKHFQKIEILTFEGRIAAIWVKAGGDLKAGTYTAEVIQGLNRQMVKIGKIELGFQ
jgi:hypothetical protein